MVTVQPPTDKTNLPDPPSPNAKRAQLRRVLLFPLDLLALCCHVPGLLLWRVMPRSWIAKRLIPCRHGAETNFGTDAFHQCVGATRFHHPRLFRFLCRHLYVVRQSDGTPQCLCSQTESPKFRPPQAAYLLLAGIAAVAVMMVLAVGLIRLTSMSATPPTATASPSTKAGPVAAKRRLSNTERAAAFAASAREFQANGGFASARIQFKNALALTPKDLSLLLGLAECAAKCGKRDEARQTLVSALTLDPKCAEAVRQLAILAAEDNDFAEALIRTDQLCTLRPADAAAYRLRARCQDALHNLPAAREAGMAAIKLDPENLDGLVFLGSLELRLHATAAAEPLFRHALALKPDSVAAQIGVAGVLMERKDYAQVVHLLEDWIRKYPDVKDLLPILGEVYTATGDLQGAVAVYRRSVGARWTSVYAQREMLRGVLMLGDRLLAAGRVEDAIAFYREMLIAHTYMFDVRRHLMQVLISIQRPEDAYAAAIESTTRLHDPVGAGLLLAELFLSQGFISMVEQQCVAATAAGANDPRIVLAGRFRARIALNTQDLPRAERELLAYLKAKPEDMECEAWLAGCYRNQGRKDDAVKRLRDAAARYPDEPLPDLVLAGWFVVDGRRDDAIACYRTVVKRAPDNLPALCALAMLLGEQKDTLDEAQDFASKARALHPKSPYATDALGWVQFRRGSVEQSMALLTEATTQQPGNPQIRYHLARALQKLGNRDEAERSVQIALATPQPFRERPDAEALLRELRPAGPGPLAPGPP